MLSKLFMQIITFYNHQSQARLLSRIDQLLNKYSLQLHYPTRFSGNLSAQIYGYFVVVIRALMRSRTTLRSQQQKIEKQNKHIDQLQRDNTELLQKISRLEQLIAKLSQEQNQWNRHPSKMPTSAHATESEQEIRQELVLAMNLALQYWQSNTKENKQENKLSFASKSGLWRVYIDRGTPQTRTLDKYLNIKTLPKAPRWRSVLQSIDYILRNCQESSQERETLLELRAKFSRYFY